MPRNSLGVRMLEKLCCWTLPCSASVGHSAPSAILTCSCATSTPYSGGGHRRILGDADRDRGVQRGRRQPVDRRSRREIRRLDADDAPIIGLASSSASTSAACKLASPAANCASAWATSVGVTWPAAKRLRVSLSVRCENANVVLLHFEIRGVARHVHVGGRRRKQHRFFHDAQRLARGGNLAFRLAHVVGGLLAVEQRLRAVDSDRTRGGVALDRVGRRRWASPAGSAGSRRSYWCIARRPRRWRTASGDIPTAPARRLRRFGGRWRAAR